MPTLVSIADAHLSSGITALVRTSLNVPIENGKVTSPFRLEACLGTIKFLSARGVKVVLLSHIGSDATMSLKPVYEYLRTKIQLSYVDDVVGEKAAQAVAALKPGEVLMLENVRRDIGEVSCNFAFAQKLARFGDIYVNDDFAVAHRAHATVVKLPTLVPSYAGLQLMREIDGLTPALAPESPSLAIVGGAKFLTKEALIRTMLQRYDRVMVAGALANDVFKVRGIEVGKSLVSGGTDLNDLIKNSKMVIPSDVTVLTEEKTHVVKKLSEVVATDTIYDAGPATIKDLQQPVQFAKVVVWNGPLGNFERGFHEQTEALAALVAQSSARSIVGGGDTIAAIQHLKLEDKFTFISTAGGAMLDFLVHGTLPGLEALKHPADYAPRIEL